MRTKEDINKDYNVSALKIGHLTATLALRERDMDAIECEVDAELDKVKALQDELKELELVLGPLAVS